MERTHHELSMSKWPAWSTCPFHDDDGKKSSSSEAGTALHDELELVLKGDLDSDMAAPSVGYAAGIIRQLANGNDLHIEEKLEIKDPLSSASGISGYADVWWMDGSHIHVADFKSGGQSEIPYAIQLMGYAYAIYTMYGGQKTDLNNIFLHVVYGADFKTETYVTSLSECTLAAEDMVKRRSNPEAYSRNISHACRWCRHRGECEEVKRKLENFEKDIIDMNDTQKLEHFAKISAIIKAETERIKDAINVNESISSDGIVYTKKHCDGKATGTDIVHLVKLAGEYGVTVTADEIIPVCSVSKKAWTDLVKARARSAGVKAALLGDWYAECSTFGEGFDKLVRSTK